MDVSRRGMRIHHEIGTWFKITKFVRLPHSFKYHYSEIDFDVKYMRESVLNYLDEYLVKKMMIIISLCGYDLRAMSSVELYDRNKGNYDFECVADMLNSFLCNDPFNEFSVTPYRLFYSFAPEFRKFLKFGTSLLGTHRYSQNLSNDLMSLSFLMTSFTEEQFKSWFRWYLLHCMTMGQRVSKSNMLKQIDKNSYEKWTGCVKLIKRCQLPVCLISTKSYLNEDLDLCYDGKIYKKPYDGEINIQSLNWEEVD
jgi:hypothetical protein